MNTQNKVLFLVAAIGVATMAACATLTDTPNQPKPQVDSKNVRSVNAIKDSAPAKRKLVKSDKISNAKLNDIIKGVFLDSQVEKVKINVDNAGCLPKNFDGFSSLEFTADSEVFVALVSGNLKWPFGGSGGTPEAPIEFTGTQALVILNSENGEVLAAKFLK